jgi:hypothetical protein
MDIVEKTRRLKKYEASEAVAFSSEVSPGMDFLSPFGPLIGRTRISVDLIDHLNAVSDAILTPDQGAEFELSEADCSWGGEDSLQSCVARAIRTYVESVEHEPARLVQMENFWVVSQFAGTPSPVHFHSGDLSGKQRFARSLISFKPVIGDLYVFPGWLLHGAEPFRGTGERRWRSMQGLIEPFTAQPEAPARTKRNTVQ